MGFIEKNYLPLTLVVLFVIFLLTTVLSGFMPSPKSLESTYCNLENSSFKAGEKLVYKAYYNWQFVWVPAGEAVFQVKENKDHYEIVVTGKTYPTYDYLFKVRDYYYSKIDKKTLLPNNFVRVVEQGDYRKFDSIAFDHNKKKAFSFNGKNRKSAVKNEISFDYCIHDLLSVLYFMRNIDVSDHRVGDFIPVKMLFDEKVYPIKVRYTGREQNLDVKGLGVFNTITVVPDLITGTVFKDGNKMKVWVSDDGNKIPLLIESPLAVGSAKAVLKSYSGQRHSMTSKIR